MPIIAVLAPTDGVSDINALNKVPPLIIKLSKIDLFLILSTI